MLIRLTLSFSAKFVCIFVGLKLFLFLIVLDIQALGSVYFFSFSVYLRLLFGMLYDTITILSFFLLTRRTRTFQDNL